MIVAKIQNFTEKELACRCGCGLLNISDEAKIAIQAFRYYLNRFYKKNIRIIPTSACRCINHNNSSEVGSSTTSRHQGTYKLADAFDIWSPDLNYEDLYYRAIECKQFSTIIKYDKSKFIHVDTRPRPDYAIENWEWDK